MKSKTSTFTAITSSKTSEWYTPEWLIKIVREFYDGEIDLDPASCELAQSWIKAKEYYTEEDDGFCKNWWGKVWVNPPYGNKKKSNYGSSKWCFHSVYQSMQLDTEILLLVGGSSEGKRFAQKCGLTLQFNKRIKFIDCNGNEQQSPPPAPDLIYLGDRTQEFITHFGHLGNIYKCLN